VRKLIEQTVCDLWVQGYDETTNVFWLMGWDYSGEEGDGYYLTRVNGWVLIHRHWCPDLEACIAACSDEALLAWLDAQLCQKYR
jgi:NAD-dependent dihydropyrimidine dehydrogenase PreA subunit